MFDWYLNGEREVVCVRERYTMGLLFYYSLVGLASFNVVNLNVAVR